MQNVYQELIFVQLLETRKVNSGLEQMGMALYAITRLMNQFIIIIQMQEGFSI